MNRRPRPPAVLLLLAALAAALPIEATGAEAPETPPLPNVRQIVRQRRRAIARVETFEHYLPGLVRRGGRLLNPFPLGRTLGDAFSFVFFVPSIALHSLRRHLGSGVLIDPEGYLLTNHHVVKDADRVTVRLTDQAGVRRKFDGKVVGIDPDCDIALVKIDPKKFPLTVAPVGDSEQLVLGDWVVAIGHPVNLTGTVTCGVVSGLHRRVRSNRVEDFIQVEAAVNPGNSGGPILNTRGEVVGIVSLGMFPAQNIGFAVPTHLVTPFLDDLKTHGKPRRGYLGIAVRTVTPELAKDKELEAERGAYVAQVAAFAPAGEAGLKQGDVILKIAGRDVAEARDVHLAVLRTPPGTKLPMTVRRGDKELAIEAAPRLLRPRLRIF